VERREAVDEVYVEEGILEGLDGCRYGEICRKMMQLSVSAVN